jgi:hypothetical protein
MAAATAAAVAALEAATLAAVLPASAAPPIPDAAGSAFQAAAVARAPRRAQRAGEFFKSKLQSQVRVRFPALAARTRHGGDAHPGVEVEASGALAHYFPEVLVVLEGSPDAVENGSSSPELVMKN